MRSSRFGEIPSDLGAIIDTLRDFEERLRTLEAPSGEALAQTIDRTNEAVRNLRTELDEYIAERLPELIQAEVAAQIAALP